MLSERAVKVLFAYVQQQDPELADDFGNAVEDDDNEMVISEFRATLPRPLQRLRHEAL